MAQRADAKERAAAQVTLASGVLPSAASGRRAAGHLQLGIPRTAPFVLKVLRQGPRVGYYILLSLFLYGGREEPYPV